LFRRLITELREENYPVAVYRRSGAQIAALAAPPSHPLAH
jgi:hypothetical protein